MLAARGRARVFCADLFVQGRQFTENSAAFYLEDIIHGCPTGWGLKTHVGRLSCMLHINLQSIAEL